MAKETGMLVQKLRLQRGWSQEQLAELSMLSTRTIQRIERGKSASAESLKALAAVFEVDFLTLKEPEMDRPSMAGVSSEEALAFAQVRRIRRFYFHLVQFLVVIGVLTAANLLTYPRHLWVGWVALGWGSAVLLHGIKVFGRLPFLTADWERRQVEKYLGRRL